MTLEDLIPALQAIAAARGGKTRVRMRDYNNAVEHRELREVALSFDHSGAVVVVLAPQRILHLEDLKHEPK